MEISSTNHSIAGISSFNSVLSNNFIGGGINAPSDFLNSFRQFPHSRLEDIITRLTIEPGKKSFLVFQNNKYINILTKNIAFFYIRHESAMIACFDRQEYFVNYSLEQLQSLVPASQFYRLNRQCLINFSAVKEVEHYFARKLLVNVVIPTKEKLIVSKDKVSDFLHWLDNR